MGEKGNVVSGSDPVGTGTGWSDLKDPEPADGQGSGLSGLKGSGLSDVKGSGLPEASSSMSSGKEAELPPARGAAEPGGAPPGGTALGGFLRGGRDRDDDPPPAVPGDRR